MFAQLAATLVVSSPIFLIPHLHLQEGVSLVSAGALAAAPNVGTLLSLVAWGAVVDRFGERLGLTAGLALVTLGGAAATTTSSIPLLAGCFFVCGIGAASSSSASGRLVVGWFPAERRGLAMGIRQTALPLGVASAALLVPLLVEHRGLSITIIVITTVAALATLASALLVVDPPHPTGSAAGATTNPYRADRTLLRIHAASALLVIPQYTVWTYMLLWLIDDRSWRAATAAILVAATHVLSSFGRIGVGWWSDRVGSRLRPMRQVAVLAAVTMAAVGLLQDVRLVVPIMVLAAVVTVSDNGLAFTAVAEIAGSRWSGRALGLQNTGQYLTASFVPPLIGAAVASWGYGWAFGLTSLFAVIAVALVPVPRRGSPDHATTRA